jgi:hypothetical protein
MTHDANFPTPPSTVALHQLLDGQLSLPSRLGYVALLIGSAMMTTVVGALLLTEPGLPFRTRVSFAALIVIGLAWIGFATWVLKHRRPLLAPHRIVAGRMAVTFTALFVVGALAVGQTTGGRAPYAAAAVGGVMLAAAIAILIQARRTFARLTERRAALERELGRPGT